MAQNEKVIISVELRDKGVTTGSKKAKDSINGLTDAEKRLNKATKDLEFQQSKEAKQLAELQIKAQLAAKANKELAISTINATKATKQGKTQTGLNNAILVEAGRAASDVQYGMMGMANNIGQLTTLMGQHMQTQGGFIASMKELKGSIIGVGGIMIAIQLFISFLPKIEKWFKSFGAGARFLSETMKEASQTVEGTIGKFETYTRTLKDSSKPQKEQQDAIKALNKEFPEFVKSLKEANLSLEDVSKSTEAATKIEKLYRESIIKTAMAKAAQAKIDKEAAAKLQNEIDLKLKAKELGFDSVEQMEKEIEAFDKLSRGQKKTQSIQRKRLAEGKESIKNFEEENKAIDENIKLLTQYTDIQAPEEKEKKKGKKKKTKEFEEELLDLSKLELKFRRQAEKKDQESAEERIVRRGLEAEEDVEITRKAFVEKEKARLLDFQKGKALSEQQIKVIEDQAQAETDAVITQIEARTEAELNALREREAAKTNLQKQINEERDNELEAERQARFYTGQVSQAIAQKEADDVFFANRKAELERELNAVNLSNAKKLDLENQLSNLKKNKGQVDIENEQAVQEAKLALANRGAAALVDIIGKETKAGKAVAATMATINTYQAVTNALKFGKTPFKYVDAAATAAQGFAQVKSILDTTSPATSGGSTGGGGGVAQTITPPDFNIIGSTGVNQLATAIGGTTQEPIKAYVVSSEVTTAQELDRNIVDSASL